ncbi:hypothetical protein WJX81_000779 [Elliptochloris bilobata]|uniref:PAS domain-containing protein n=1 Tax=Elliptochloris bilobata TaxID=381761 RepID=A0AAW1QW86_9CHLO
MDIDLSFFERVAAEVPGAPVPDNEAERLVALGELELADHEDPALESMCTLLTSLFNVPLAAVAVVERETSSWLASSPSAKREPARGLTRFPRAHSMCAYTLVPPEPEMMVVEDCLADRRFMRNAFVAHPPYVRFYAGCPLLSSSGYRLGALCIVDTAPRRFSEDKLRLLAGFADMAVRRLEKRIALQRHMASSRRLLRTLECFTSGILLVDTRTPEWPILHANEACAELTGEPAGGLTGESMWKLYSLVGETQEELLARHAELAPAHDFMVHARARQARDDDATPLVTLRFRPASEGSLDPYTPHVRLPATATCAPQREKLSLYFAVIEAGGAPAGQPCQAPDLPAVHGTCRPPGTPSGAVARRNASA